MKVLKLETFEGIQKVPKGQSMARTEPVPQAVAGKSPAGGDVKIHALPGGSFLVDWGEENQLGALAYVGAANVKGALVVLDDAEKAKLLK